MAAVLSSGLASVNNLVPSFSVQRSVVEQWSVIPVVDGEQVETLRVAYRKALNPNDPEVDKAIEDQIVSLCVRYSLLPAKETIQRILATDKAHEEAVAVCESLGNEIKRSRQKIAFLCRRCNALEPECQERLNLELQMLAAQEDLRMLEGQRTLLACLADPVCKDPTATRVGSSVIRKQSPSSRQDPRGLSKSESSDTTQLILTALQARMPAGYLPPTDVLWETTRNPALVDQAEDQIARLESLLDAKFRVNWVCSGCTRDVPRCTCYVGHVKDCEGERYVWVLPENYELLREFTQVIMTLGASNAPQDIPARSPAFSPALR
jgi:hypothetical protein